MKHIKRLFWALSLLLGISSGLVADDYYNYGQWHLPEAQGSYTGAGGFIDKNGKLGDKGNEYIFFTVGDTGFIYQVITEDDSQKHPDNPDSTGNITPRHFKFISKHILHHCGGHDHAFFVDDTGIYHGGGRCGVKRWDFDWSNEKLIVPGGGGDQTFSRNSRTGDFWTGSGNRRLYKWDGHRWVYQLTYPNLGGSHQDGMTIANDILFVSDMTSDYIATYKLDKQGNVINPDAPDHIYKYNASPVVEGMGFGPNNHIWISGYGNGIIYEIGGGKLQEQLASCSQGLTLLDSWEMLSSRCDIKHATGFRDAIIMKMVGNHLVVITDDNATKSYYENLGYETNATLDLSRGEGFWIRAETNGTLHALNGVEETTSIHLKKDTTRFIGLPGYHTLDLDETFGDKPVKEIRYWDSNGSKWLKWQPNHVDTNLTQIVNDHGFYICVADDFDIDLPNLIPVAKISGDLNITVGSKLRLDGAKSFDRDGHIVSYIWREGNETLSTDSILQKDDFQIGWHKIILSVTDDDGATGSKEVIVRVMRINTLPTVDLGEDINLTQDQSHMLSPSVEDPDGYILSYEWKIDGNVIAATPYLSLEHLALGEHNITLRVIDNDLGRAQDSMIATITPEPDMAPPVITVLGNNPAIVLVGEGYHDEGAIALDDRDGNITVESNISVNTAIVGEYNVSYRAIDHAGNSASAIRKVIVQDPSANTPPEVDLGSDRTIAEGETLRLYADARDSDGDIASYRWHAYGSLETSGADAIIKDLTPGQYTITVTVEDDKGAMASDSILVSVLSKDAIDTTPPIITISGDNPATVALGSHYSDAGATAWDDKDGNITVGVEYNITTSKAGVYLVTYTAQDRAGNRAIARRSVLVQDGNSSSGPDATPPVITLLGNDPMVVMRGEAFVDPGVIVVDDHDGQIGYSMRHNVDSSRLGSYLVIYEAVDSAGNEANATRKVYVKDAGGNKPPVANAGIDHTVAKGEDVLLDGGNSKDPDGDIVSYEWREGNTVLSTQKEFVETGLDFGAHTFTLTVKDNDGLSDSDTVTVRIVDPSDTTPPIAAITAPTENAKVTLKADVIGTANDENLESYTLAISPVGKETYTTIADGTDPVINGTLGTIDASTLQNGIYDVKLTVVDQNGATSEAHTKVIIDGKAKIGNFSFTVMDFDLKVGGIPVQVNRTYSTLQRFNKLDFTYAWSIDYQNVKIEESVKPGLEWRIEPMYLLGLPLGNCFKPKKQHIVNISLPDGTTESFEYKFAKECDHGYYPGSFWDAPILKPLNGTEATLKAIGATTVMVASDGRLIDGNNLEVYDPNEYKLTLSNGVEYILDEKFGIKKVINNRGETLTYNRNGIQSSRGVSLTFERDSEDRITKITDLSGRTVQYHYDSRDDLDYVIDQGGAKTVYRYQSGHLLEEYIDPSGLRVAKNIYDASGRLIKTIDSDGNEVEFIHDIDGREEIVKDKLGRMSVFVYDDAGNVLSQTNPLGETTTHTYDEKGHELTKTDPLGHTTTMRYDDKGNLLSTTDALGHTETTTYNDKQSPTAITDKNGNTMRIAYDSYNAPTSMTTANGATTVYTYDNFNNKISSTDEHNQTTTYKYDEYGNIVERFSKGNILKETRPDGTVIEHTYDDRSNMLSTKTTYPDGTVTNESWIYDAYDRMTSHTDIYGQTFAYAYDARGNKISETDGKDRTTKYTYNAHNKLIKTEYPDGTVESKTYDAMDNLLSETNREGETTRYEYDAADRLTKTTYPDGTTTTKSYDAAGRVVSTTDQNGNTTTYEYDAVGNKIAQTDALGNKTTYTYDAAGNLLSVTDALGQTTRYEYNALNQRVKTIYPDGTVVKELKNKSGLPIAKIDELGRQTRYGYDSNHTIPLLNSVTLPNAATTTYAYDAAGHKIAQTDALGRTTRYTYEPTGELAGTTLPGGQTSTRTYSAYGLLLQTTDYAGKAKKFIYDSYGKLVRIELADGGTVTYDYTPSARIRRIRDAQGSVSYTYDAMGRIASVTDPKGNTITYSYDGVGNITQIETPTQTISKTYDALNRLKTVTDAQGTVTYDYDAIGRQTQVTYPNGVTTSYAYDSRNRIVNIEHKSSNGEILQSFAYSYDAVGNRTKVVEHSGRTVEYSYNEANQLTKEVVTNDPNGHNTTTTYTYDKVGNLLTKTIDGTSEDYSYNSNDQLIQKGSITYTYDSNGNLISDGTSTYSYDDKNRLIKAVTPNETIEYTYDANDNRIAKTTSHGTTTYLVDANTPFAQVITESKSDGTEIQYTYGNDLLTQSSDADTLLYLTDAIGSTRALADNVGTITDNYTYSPYGALLEHLGSSDNEFLFSGEQLDPEAGNYYLRARYYNPATTRFLSRDTYDGKLTDPLSQNHYLYAGGNPVMYVDPSGHFFGGMMSLGMGIMSTIVSGYSRIAGTVQRGTALAIDAHFVGLGIQLRNEAISSIVYLLNNGGSQEAMDAAYKKYYFATEIISSMADLTRLTQSAIGWSQAASSFANAIGNTGIRPLSAYRVLSAKIGGGVEKIVQIQSRKIISQELSDLYELIGAAYRILNKGRGLAN